MGTSNFHRVNATKVFAVLMNQPADEDGEYYAPEQWEVDDFIDYLRKQLEKDSGFYECGRDPYELHSFPSRVIGEITSDTEFAGGLISGEIVITAVMRSGYYEGACLDWHITKRIDGDEYDDVAEYEGYDNSSKLVVGLHKSIIVRWFSDEEKRLIEFVEKVFAQASMPMEVVATFSNGETIYKMAN